MSTQAYYITKLKERLTKKQRTSPRYSLRAFARDIDIHSGTLSLILNGKRDLPLKKASAIASHLNLSPDERSLFIESLFKTKKSTIDQIKVDKKSIKFMLDDSCHQIIAEWEHYVVLELFSLDTFVVTRESVQEKLKITKHRAHVVIENLIMGGLIKEMSDGSFEKIHENINTTEDIKSLALKEAHKENLAIGSKKLDEVAVELRDFSSVTLGVDPEKLLEAKAVIREFRQKMIALLNEGNKQDVYQLAIQFYPMTNKKGEDNE